MLGAIKICHGSCSHIQNPCHLIDEKTSSSNGLGSIKFEGLFFNENIPQYLHAQ